MVSGVWGVGIWAGRTYDRGLFCSDFFAGLLDVPVWSSFAGTVAGAVGGAVGGTVAGAVAGAVSSSISLLLKAPGLPMASRKAVREDKRPL